MMAMAQIRAAELLRRLPVGPVIGAEVGVFCGDMSAQLLRRADLHLLMVDAWEGDGLSYAEGSAADDFHARMTEAEQLECRARAIDQTFLFANRRTVLRARSVAAAAEQQSKSLDFVFIDADHSYEGCSADIAAWWPTVKAGGLISGHDYGHPRFNTVTLAVNEFVDKTGLQLSLGLNKTWFARKP